MKKLGIAFAGTVGLAALVAQAARSDELFLGYLLNTVVNKIPFPTARLAAYRAAGMRIGPNSNIMMHVRVLTPNGVEVWSSATTSTSAHTRTSSGAVMNPTAPTSMDRSRGRLCTTGCGSP